LILTRKPLNTELNTEFPGVAFTFWIFFSVKKMGFMGSAASGKKLLPIFVLSKFSKMEDQSLFYEKQRFTQWWLWAFFLVMNGLFMYGSFQQLVVGVTFGDNPMNNAGLLIVTLFFIVFTVFFWLQAMETKVDASGIHLKFFPYHRTWKFYPWEDIAGCEVKKYSPVFDYGGWGLRNGAYNVSGNKGLLLQFKNGPKLMIGTQKPEALRTVLQQTGKLA
jgi:hypothetical protein